METVLSIILIVTVVMWAGLSLATFFGKMVFDLLPFTKVSPPQNGAELVEEEENSPEQKELALVA